MAIITYPLNNIEYTAEDAELYHATRTSGVFANDDFPITISGDGNVVTIGEGIGWIRNSKFSGKVVANKAEMSLDLGLPHATYPRIDAVVLQFSANSNATEIIVKNGTAQTNPAQPEVVRTESVYELHLYHVYREAGATSVTASNVTDLRSDSAYCGIMSDDVTMLGDDYVSKNMVGVANGVASLDENGLVPKTQINYTTGPIAATFTDGGSSGTYISGTCNYYKTWNIATIVVSNLKIRTTSSMSYVYAEITGLPSQVLGASGRVLLKKGAMYDAGAESGGTSVMYIVTINPVYEGKTSMFIERLDGSNIASGKDIIVSFDFVILCDE